MQAGIERAGGSAAMVEVDGTQPNDGTEGLAPIEMRKLEREVWIALEGEALGARRWFVLVNHQGACKTHAVVAQMPALGVVERRPGERSSADHQKISTPIDEPLNVRPCCLWKR